MNSKNQIHRRTFLKGLGAAVALPLLESMAPMKALAKAGAVTENGAPIRLAFMFVPNGVHLEDWTPIQVGANYELPYILEPLQRFKRDINVLSGLTHDKGRANGDGAGDHARSAGVFLTGAQPLKSEGIMLISKPNQIRWETTAPYQSILLGNQKSVASCWALVHSINF